MPTCEECQRSFSSNTTLKQHMNSFHTLWRTTFQCWHCHNIYARKETVITHSQQKHSNWERKFIVVETVNKKYKPTIFKPDPWTPPPQAWTKKGTTYKVKIPGLKPTLGNTTEIHYLSIYQSVAWELTKDKNCWGPLTVNDIDKHFNMKVSEDMLFKDLELPASKTLIISSETVCRDEIQGSNTVTDVKEYNAFKGL